MIRPYGIESIIRRAWTLIDGGTLGRDAPDRETDEVLRNFIHYAEKIRGDERENDRILVAFYDLKDKNKILRAKLKAASRLARSPLVAHTRFISGGTGRFARKAAKKKR